MELKVGVLGFGGMGHYHAENVKVEGVTFVSACDIEAIQLADAEEMGVKPYLNDEDAFFADPEINTVLLTVPNHLHKSYAIKAARAGKNIICEKPAALTPADFDEMVAEAEKCGVLFEVHQNRRWDKDFAIAKRVYQEDLVGNIFDIESNLHMPSGRIHNWHQFPEMGGGMVYDWGVHQIDQALNMIDDKIETVYADLKSMFHAAVEDTYKIIIKFRGGQTITLNQAGYVLKPYPRWLICGNKGTVEILNFDGSGKLYTTTEYQQKLPPRIEPNIAGPTRSYVQIPPGHLLEKDLPEVNVKWLDFYRNYLDVLNGKAEFAIKNSEVRRVLEVMMAVFESGKTRKSVHFAYDD